NIVLPNMIIEMMLIGKRRKLLCFFQRAPAILRVFFIKHHRLVWRTK
ncbi:hypothetical protein D018_0672B, partial [Vibrio parahaemolyticus VP2007-007]